MIITITKTSGQRQLLLPVILFILLLCCSHAKAQSLLSKQISINFNQQRLGDILLDIGKKGGFYFSYNGKVLPQDSLVSITANNQTVSVIMAMLFHGKYDVEERKNYLIITLPLPNLSLVNADITNDNNTYSISGLVINERTGERLMNASVYLKQQLVSVLTDEHGYFRLKFRADKPGHITLTAS